MVQNCKGSGEVSGPCVRLSKGLLKSSEASYHYYDCVTLLSDLILVASLF